MMPDKIKTSFSRRRPTPLSGTHKKQSAGLAFTIPTSEKGQQITCRKPLNGHL